MPAALAVLVVLSVATLLLYRQAVERQIEVRRGEVLALGRLAAEAVAVNDQEELAALRRASGAAVGVVAGGGELVVGDESLLVPAIAAGTLARIDRPTAFGPGDTYGDRIVAVVPMGLASGTGPDATSGARFVRVDLRVPDLATEWSRLAILTPLVLGVDGLLAVLVLLFLWHAFRPWRELVRRAEEAGIDPAGRDEAAFLIETFERSLAGLAAASGEPELAALRQTLGDGGEAGLLLLDADARVLAANAAARGLLGEGLTPGAALDRLAAGQPAFLDAVRPALDEARSLASVECAVDTAAGQRIVGLTLQALRRTDGGVRGFLLLFADLTESRQQADRERLADGLAQLGEMAAGVAHELRNGLAALSGYLELVERRPDAAPEPHHLAALRQECRNLERVVEDFLAFARPGTARLEEVDLAELARRTLASPDLPTERLGFDDRSGEPATLAADVLLLRRALANLLRNAVEAQPEGGEIEVSLERQGGDWVLAVEDRGPGLPEAVRERLFQPFVTGRPGGTGLGLPLAQRIAALHGGRVELHDRAGGGTRAELRLPAGKFG